MRISIVGGGPAGLLLAYLMKTTWPRHRVRVIEQNARDVTFGFGVVLSGRARELIGEGNAAVAARLDAISETWSEQHIVHRGETVVVDGSSFSGVARIDLLAALQGLCEATGVELVFGQRLTLEALRAGEPGDCDVLVGADGANSIVRDAHADGLGTRVVDLKNYYAWYGVATPYPAHTLTFKEIAGGVACAHHYRYQPAMSTFVTEVDGDAWQASGLYALDDDGRRRAMEQLFADTLRGQPLVSNRSLWRRWRLVRNDRWWLRNIVLIGDALRTAHPSIGSGTRLAMEDAIALWRAFEAGGQDVAAIFAAYEAARRPVRERLDRAAERSIDWYEHLAERMPLAPHDFAYDYLLRTGVMTPERLQRHAPRFMADWRNAGGGQTASPP